MVAVFSHLYRIENSQIFDLVVADSINKVKAFFFLIWFDTSDEMKIT